jgi:site-specific recombinase XerD
MSAAYIDAFIAYITDARGVSAHTAEAYAHDAVQFMDFLASIWGEERSGDFAAVAYRTMRTYIAHLHGQKYERASISRKVASLRSFFDFLIASSLAGANPAALAQSPKLDKMLPEYLYRQEVTALLSAPDPDSTLGCRDRAMLEILYATGMRRSELVAVKLSDIDMQQRQMRVIGKGDKEREVLFGEPAAVALDDYLERARPALLRKRADGRDEEVCFLSKSGRPLAASYIYVLVRKYVLEAGVSSSISPHDLRHTFATHMLNGGADLRTIQELLGHASLGSTEIYTHVTTRRMKEVYAETHPLAKGGADADE